VGWYQPRPIIVEARQLGPEPGSALAEWVNSASGTTAELEIHVGSHYLLTLHTLKQTIVAWPGDWVVKDAEGDFTVVSEDAFGIAYQQVAPVSEVP
jgi:hypothetical protein